MTIKDKCRSAAKTFYKAVKGKVDFVNAEAFVNKMGFTVIFFNTPEGDIEAARYGVLSDTDENESFTYNSAAHIIFINDNVPCERKLYLLLHEIGHIMLNHLGDGRIRVTDKVLLDIEANAFVYDVLQRKPYAGLIYILTALGIICISLSIYILKPADNPSMPVYNTIEPSENTPDEASPTSPNQTVSEQTGAEKASDIVYITPTGNKYHRANCIYTKDKDCTALAREEAEKNYTPCSVCNP